MKFKKILLALISSALVASSASVTAFAKETDKKYDYAAISDRIAAVFGSDDDSEKEIISDNVKKIYKDILDNYLGKVGQTDSENTDTGEESLSAENSEEEFILQADNTEFTWDRASDTGITIQTNSVSKTITVIKNGIPYSSSLISRNIVIDYGTIYLSRDFLEELDNGENALVFMLKEGNLDITVNITDSQTEMPVEENQITAKETVFEWDKSDLIGIAVNTNSNSKNVAITKAGELFASNDDRGVYIVLGRVGITAKILKKLDVGENQFDDGTIDITVNVTDKRHSSDTAEITADKTEFTWDRNSSDSISIHTNSKSDSISVRQSGKIFSTSDKKHISVSSGIVTMEPEFLSKLNDGENELKLIFDDGNITVKINVTGSVETSKNSSEASKNTGSLSGIGALPDTGSTMTAIGAAIALLSAGLSVILFSGRRNKQK